MNIEGTYRVNVEQTVRKIVEGEHASIQRMLRKYMGDKVDDIPEDPKREAKVEKLISDYQKNELATTMRLEITAERVSIRSTDGDADYRIKSLRHDGSSRCTITLDSPFGDGDRQWDAVAFGDSVLTFTGESEMSGFVWDRV